MRKRCRLAYFVALTVVMCTASASHLQAQVRTDPPFFGRGSALFDPEVRVVQSGAILDARATVSADQKYVTITTGATNSRLQALERFEVEQAAPSAGGLVGSSVGPSLLNRTGMTPLRPR